MVWEKIGLHVKDEGYNLNIMIIVFKYVVNYELLGLEESYQRSWFENAFSKACQYGIIDDKCEEGWNMFPLNLTYIQKCITWPKKLGK